MEDEEGIAEEEDTDVDSDQSTNDEDTTAANDSSAVKLWTMLPTSMCILSAA